MRSNKQKLTKVKSVKAPEMRYIVLQEVYARLQAERDFWKRQAHKHESMNRRLVKLLKRNGLI